MRSGLDLLEDKKPVANAPGSNLAPFDIELPAGADPLAVAQNIVEPTAKSGMELLEMDIPDLTSPKPELGSDVVTSVKSPTNIDAYDPVKLMERIVPKAPEREKSPFDGELSISKGEYKESFLDKSIDFVAELTGLRNKYSEGAKAAYQTILAQDLGVRPSDISPDMATAFSAGFGHSVTGLIRQVEGGEEYSSIDPSVSEYLPMSARLAMGAGAMIGDLPYMALGAKAGGAGGPITAMAGAFALPEGLRAYYMNKLDKGEVSTPGEFIEALKTTVKATAKGAATGLTTGAVGKVTAPLGTMPKVAAEAITMTAVGYGLEGHIPTTQDFIDSVILLGGFKAISNTPVALKNMKTLWVKTGRKPKDIVEDAKADPELARVIAEEVKIPKEVIDKTLAKVEAVEKAQAELAAKEALVKNPVKPETLVKEELKIKGEKVQEIKEGKTVESLNELKQLELFDNVKTPEPVKTGIEILEPTKKVATKVTKKADEKPQIEKDIVEKPKTKKAKVKKDKPEEIKVDKPAEKEPITDLDLQTGAPIPKKLSTQVHPFRDTNVEHTNTMRKLMQEKINNVDASPEVFTRYLMNEVNRYLNGENVPIEKVRYGLSELAARADNLKLKFDKDADFNAWRGTVQEAARWARGAERSSGGTQLNMMIPVNEIPQLVKDVLKTIKRIKDDTGFIKPVDIYRNKEVFNKTGFWLGKDRKWRYEVDNNKIDIDFTDLRGKSIQGGGSNITRTIKSPELFEAVPELKDIRIDISPSLEHSGSYHPSTKVIELKGLDKTVLIHELQHAINDIVGSRFKGSNVEVEHNKIDTHFISELQRAAKTPEVREKIEKMIEDEYTGYKGSLMMASQNLRNQLKKSDLLNEEMIAVMEWHKNTSSFENYLKNPGEMEARLVERRIKMTPEEKKAEPPWETLETMLYNEAAALQSTSMASNVKGISSRLYSGVDVPEATKQIIKGAKALAAYTAKARGMKEWKPGQAANMIKEEFIRSGVDRSGNIRKELLDQLGDEGYRVIQKMYLSKGASSLAAEQLKQMRKEVYDGLNSNEKRILDNLILADRMLDIGKYKTEKQFKFPEGLTPKEAASYNELFQFTERISPEQANLLKQRAAAYFDWMKKPLKDMLDAELITKAEHDALASHNYRRLKLVDIFDKRYQSKSGKTKRTVYDSGVESLSRGRNTDVFEPSSEVMALEVFNRAYGRILNNAANKTLLDLARADKKNPFVAIKESSTDKVPSGWDRIFVYDQGQRKALYLSPRMSKEWITNSPEMSYKMSQIIRYSSASPVLRTFATGIDWGFALANLPRDIMHIWYAARVFENGQWKPLYNSNMPVYGMQMGADLTRVFSDAVMRKGRYLDYIKEGGGMEFLVHQGRLMQRGRHLEGGLDKTQDVLGYFGESSEIITRLAIRDRVIRKRAKEQGITYEEAYKDKKITQEGTFAARDYMDFGQGGGVSKALDNGLPYLNAGIQGTRGFFRSFKDSPIESTYKLAQFAALVTGMYVANQSLAPETMQALKGDMATQGNLIIALGDSFGFDDEKGQIRYPYIKIPIDPSQKFFKTFFEASYDKATGQEVDVDGVVNTLSQISPVDISTLPPTVGATLGYMYNKDFWANEDIWRKTDKPFDWPHSKEEYIPGRTPQAMIDIGEVTGLSPERLKHSLEELVTSGSQWSWLAGQGYDVAFKEVPAEKKEFHLAEMLARTPIARRFIGITNPYNQFKTPIEEAREKSMLDRWIENRGLDHRVESYLYEGGKRSEVIDYIRKTAKDQNTMERLRDRFIFQEKIKGLPNRAFWLSLKSIPDVDARAEVFVGRFDSASPDEQAQMNKEIGIVIDAGGVISDEFKQAVMRVRDANARKIME